jgi:hypothetical protein
MTSTSTVIAAGLVTCTAGKAFAHPSRSGKIGADWQANKIPISHIVTVIERHLTDHRRRYHSGSGDALFGWLAEHVRRTWEEKRLASPWTQSARATVPRIADHEGIVRQASAGHEANLRRSSSSRDASLGDRPYASRPVSANQAPPPRVKVPGSNRGQPKQIDRAAAFRRRELAVGEGAATYLEERQWRTVYR